MKRYTEQVKDLKYWKNNADEEYLTTPISVLRYISELEKLTPIELPSDEEIEKEVIKHFPTPLNKRGEPMTQLVGHNPYGFNKFKKTFTKGYKAALEQILNQNK